ncbi:MAG: TonB-dependent receptor [Bacteroidota bacterium]
MKHLPNSPVFFWLAICLLLCPLLAFSQGNTLRGTVVDATTQAPLIGATVKVLDTEPLKGGSTDLDGRYVISEVPTGRYNVEVSYVGFTAKIITAVAITSGEATQLSVALSENRFELNEVTVTADQRTVLNESALLSARSFRVEELGRIPGGIDDPARMAKKFPGVSPNPNLLSNEINIRGNSTRAVLWRVGDVDIYNPSHFARLNGAGGRVTMLSQRVLANTDFYSGSFPADYGNALGGVFDVQFRNGNMETPTHSIQLSVLGIDAATEGPLGKSGKSSYLANYRYSTTNLVSLLLNEVSVPTYQDLSFKFHHELAGGGYLDVFGLGGISRTVTTVNLDTTQWGETQAAVQGNLRQHHTATVGVIWLQPITKDTYVKASLAGTGLRVIQDSWRLERDLVTADTTINANDNDARLTFSAFINHRFSPRHTHRSGVIVNGLHYHGFLQRGEVLDGTTDSIGPLLTTRMGRAQSLLVQAYSRSQFYLSPTWQANVGLHMMYLALTNEISLEPRASVRWQVHPKHSLSLAYGLHSQMEPFFTLVSQRPEGNSFVPINPDLRFNKAHHMALAWRYQSSNNFRLGMEAYYQHQFNLVVGTDLPVSRVAANNTFFDTWELDNGGTGRNMGIELIAERNFSQDYYVLANASLFDATYVANDGIRRNSQFNAGYIVNLAGGKEWEIRGKEGRNNLLGLNLSATYSGPQYFTGFNEELAQTSGRFQLDYANPNQDTQDGLFLVDVGLQYQINRARYSSAWSLQVNNVLNQRPKISNFFDFETGELREVRAIGLFPFLAWRINF